VIYRQSKTTFIILRQMAGGQFVKQATVYTEADARLVKGALESAAT
jgi:hypothetical protein